MASIQNLLQTAYSKHKEHDFDSAEQLYKQVLSKQPKNPDGLHFLGVLQHQRGNLPLAEQLIKQAISITPRYGTAYYHLGRIQLQTQQNDDALLSFQKAMKLMPQHLDSHYMYAIFLLKRRHHDKQDLENALNACLHITKIYLNEVNAPMEGKHIKKGYKNLENDFCSNLLRIAQTGIIHKLNTHQQLQLVALVKDVFYLKQSAYFSRLIPFLSEILIMTSKMAYNKEKLELAVLTYDTMQGIIWCTSDDLFKMDVFLPAAVEPMLAYTNKVRKTLNLKPNTIHIKSPPYNICYLSPEATDKAAFSPGNELIQMLEGQHQLNSGKLKRFLYIYDYIDSRDNFVKRAQDNNVIVRDFTQIKSPEEKFLTLFNYCAQDKIDIMISMTNNAIPTLLFQARSACIQVFWRQGMYHWHIPECDYITAPDFMRDDKNTIYQKNDKILYVANPRKLFNDRQLADKQQVITLREKLAPGKKIIGNYCRLNKITVPYLDIIRQILEANPQAHCVLAGQGDGHHIEIYLTKYQLHQRFTLLNQWIDHLIFSQIYDVFLDTFPCAGGIACTEVMAHGTPVVHMLTRENGKGFLNAYRDINLCVESVNAYLDTVNSLLQQPTYYRSASDRAKTIAMRYANLADCANLFETEMINALMRKFKALSAKYNPS